MPHPPRPSRSSAPTQPAPRLAGIERYSADDANRLYLRVWGPSFHFGLWEEGVASIGDAALRCKQKLGESLSLAPHHHVLEVGSGLGETARFLASAYGCRVTASNISDKHREECFARTIETGMSEVVTSAHADYHNLPFDDASFDAYVVQEALVHASDKHRVLAEAFRVLRPGGRIAFTDQTTRVDRLSAVECNRIAERHGSPDLFDARAFVSAAEQAGFNILDQQDWSSHMTRHFAELVEYIGSSYEALARDIDPAVIDWNLDTWRFARDKARDGAMGWVFVVAIKPA